MCVLKQTVLNWRKIKSGTSPKHLDYFSMSQGLYSKQKLAYKYQGQAGALSICHHMSLLPASCYREKTIWQTTWKSSETLFTQSVFALLKPFISGPAIICTAISLRCRNCGRSIKGQQIHLETLWNWQQVFLLCVWGSWRPGQGASLT